MSLVFLGCRLLCVSQYLALSDASVALATAVLSGAEAPPPLGTGSLNHNKIGEKPKNVSVIHLNWNVTGFCF